MEELRKCIRCGKEFDMSSMQYYVNGGFICSDCTPYTQEEKDKKVNILGTDYRWIETTAEKDSRLEDADGYCTNYAKEILIETEIFKKDQVPKIEEQRMVRSKFIKRHEIIHAFFNESGLGDKYGADEELVTWIAWQFPKILKIYQEVDAL